MFDPNYNKENPPDMLFIQLSEDELRIVAEKAMLKRLLMIAEGKITPYAHASSETSLYNSPHTIEVPLT